MAVLAGDFNLGFANISTDVCNFVGANNMSTLSPTQWHVLEETTCNSNEMGYRN